MRLPSSFYAMIDRAGGHEPVELAHELLESGAKILQLRLKEIGSRDLLAAARAIAALCRNHQATLIINDRVDIAILSDADGVHLGQQDLPIAAARRLIGPDKLIGISTHSVEQALATESAGADYIGFGAIYMGGLKNVQKAQGLERLHQVRKAVRLPIVAIGGITETTMPSVLAAGADACAIITDVVRAPNLRQKVKSLLALTPHDEQSVE